MSVAYTLIDEDMEFASRVLQRKIRQRARHRDRVNAYTIGGGGDQNDEFYHAVQYYRIPQDELLERLRNSIDPPDDLSRFVFPE